MIKAAQFFLTMTALAPIGIVYAAVLILFQTFVALIITAFSILTFCGLYALLRSLQRNGRRVPVTLESVEPLEKEPLSFLVAYALPIIAARPKVSMTEEPMLWVYPMNDVATFIALFVFVGVMMLIVHKQGLAYMNPTLAIFGWHFHQVKANKDKRGILVSRSKYPKIGKLKAVALSKRHWLDTRSEKDSECDENDAEDDKSSKPK